jgi:uncharacterized protein (DUF3820 family)
MLPGREKSGIPNGSFRGRYGLLLPKYDNSLNQKQLPKGQLYTLIQAVWATTA